MRVKKLKPCTLDDAMLDNFETAVQLQILLLSLCAGNKSFRTKCFQNRLAGWRRDPTGSMLLLRPSPTVMGAAALLLASSLESFFAWVAAGQMLRAEREQVDYDQHLFKEPGVKIRTLMNRDWRSSPSPRCPENLAPLLGINPGRLLWSYQAESSPSFLPGGVSEH